MNWYVKLLLSGVALLAALFGGFIALLMAAFSGAGAFYQIMTVVGVLVLLMFVLAQTWGWLPPRRRYLAMGAVVLTIGVAIGSERVYHAYHNSFDEVNEQGVNLTLYEPFRENTKAAALDEPSALRLAADLPRLDGATALYPLYSAFARAVYPEGDYPCEVQKEQDYVVCTNTRNAYSRLIHGEADIVFAAGPSKEQLQEAGDAGVALQLTPIGREAFVFFVNRRNSVSGLTDGQIRGIYSGEITNWSQADGKSKSIRAFQRPQNSGSQTMLEKIMGDTPLMVPPKTDVAAGMGGIIENVSAYRNYDNAIGYSFLFFATGMVKNNQIKLLEINGAAPNRENIANGTYPYAAAIYAVTLGNESENAQKLIRWILSPQGQELVEKTGYTPIGE